MTSEPKSKVVQDFDEALQRLLDHEPRHPILQKRIQTGSLRLSAANLALEAGHSRTLIAGPACRYPHIRERLKALNSKRTATKPLQETIVELRREKKVLTDQVALMATESAALLKRMQELERQLEAERTRLELLLRQTNATLKLAPPI